jgi:putative heme transporter
MTVDGRPTRGTLGKAEPESRRSLRIELSAGTMLKAVCTLGLLWLFLQLWPVLLVIGVSLMLVGLLAPPIAWLERKGMRRSFAIATVFFMIFVAVALFVGFTVPNLFAEVVSIVDRLPQTLAQIADQLQRNKLTAPLAHSVRSTRSTELLAKVTDELLSSSTMVVEIVAYAATSLFLSLYIIIDRDRMRGGLFALVPRTFHIRLSRILLKLETIVGGYMRGQVITSVLMGVFTFAVLTIARVPNAIALSAFAGVVDVLPYVGALLACGPAVLAAWSLGLPVALAVLASLVAYQELESRVLVPRIYGKALRLPAGIVIVALLAGGKLLGILGALLALPVAAAIRMVVEELRFELPGEDIDDVATRTRDEREERAFLTRAAGVPAEAAAAIATEIAEARIQEDVQAK